MHRAETNFPKLSNVFFGNRSLLEGSPKFLPHLSMEIEWVSWELILGPKFCGYYTKVPVPDHDPGKLDVIHNLFPLIYGLELVGIG